MAVSEPKEKGRELRRGILTAACCLVLAIALALPVDWALQFLGTTGDRFVNATLALSLIALLGAAGLFGNRLLTGLVLVPLVVAALSVRLLFFGLVHFSGQGFGPELFVHIEPDSLRIAWHEYDNLIYRAAAVVLVGVVAFWGMIRFGAGFVQRRNPVLAVTLLTLPVLVVGRDHLPEWQLWQAWRNWERPGRIAVTDQRDEGPGKSVTPKPSIPGSRAAAWSRTGLIQTELPTTDEIEATTPKRPRNLILLYVEALTSSIIEHPDYPGLMPNFRRLVREHGWMDQFHTSSFVTIEGVANTQCGLLFPFRSHGSGFAGRDMLAESLPCLGDVLAEAGYHQTYILGGGPMSFAGKGAFLAAHGYDDLRGWEYWQSHGHEREPGHWGMGDVDTLEQVRRTVAERQQQERPFNVTSLTVGSHIPGYVYAGCDPYLDGTDRYLDALHCTDQVIADWIERLEADGLLDDSLLVIVGDHPVFANPDMHERFGDAIYDTRLPLIIIGDDLHAPVHERGAGFDLAPTLLDLLGIRHNAEFAMGRSLAAPHDRPDYLVTRRHDIHAGRTIDNPPNACQQADPDQAPTLPLSPCEKRELLDLLHQLARAHSYRPEPMDCTSESPAEVRVPAGRIGPVAIRVNGRDWSNRFSRRGRMTHPTEPGLYALALDPAGRPSAATFLPAESVAAPEPEPLPEDISTAHAVVVAWRPANRKRTDLSSLLPGLPGGRRGAGAWLVRPGRCSPLASSLAADGNAAALSIDRTVCRRIRQ